MTLLFGFMTACQLNFTSALVNGFPSCHFTPRRNLYVIVLPSRLMPPFSMLGTTDARSGMSFPRSSSVTSKSNTKLDREFSAVVVPSNGFKDAGSAKIAARRMPPPDDVTDPCFAQPLDANSRATAIAV